LFLFVCPNAIPGFNAHLYNPVDQIKQMLYHQVFNMNSLPTRTIRGTLLHTEGFQQPRGFLQLFSSGRALVTRKLKKKTTTGKPVFMPKMLL